MAEFLMKMAGFKDDNNLLYYLEWMLKRIFCGF